MNGAISPTGERHPGEILHDDRVDGRTWTAKAADVPQTIAWVKEGERWSAVARIEITGVADRRCITKFGTDKRMLETTMMAAPPPSRPQPPEPVPVPMPMPESTKN